MPITLFINGAERESQEAQKLLDEAGIPYKSWDTRQIRMPDLRPPVLFAPEGEFVSLERIRSYVTYYQRANGKLK